MGREEQETSLHAISTHQHGLEASPKIAAEWPRGYGAPGVPEGTRSPPCLAERTQRHGEVTRRARGPEGASDKAANATPGSGLVLTFAITFPSDADDLLLILETRFTLKAKTLRTELQADTK